jgi:predicted RNA-binding Zn-ribbon protein involved in translation (DUF1610 family)
MSLSRFKPVLVCTSCGQVIVAWEDKARHEVPPEIEAQIRAKYAGSTSGKTEEALREAKKTIWETMWFSEDGLYKWTEQSVSSPNLTLIASAWACCSKCGAIPLSLRMLTARHDVADWWNPLSWFGERRWFLAGSAGKGGDLSLADDTMEKTDD